MKMGETSGERFDCCQRAVELPGTPAAIWTARSADFCSFPKRVIPKLNDIELSPFHRASSSVVQSGHCTLSDSCCVYVVPFNAFIGQSGPREARCRVQVVLQVVPLSIALLKRAASFK